MFEFYQKLLHKTNEYKDLHLEELGTDWYEDLEEIVDPYLKENKINMSKIDELNHYADIRQKEIENRRKEIIYPASGKF